MDFKLHKWIQDRTKPKPQKFGDPTIIKAGQTLHLRDWIDAAREDTEIYPTLEKYGCIDRMIVNTEQVYGDLSIIMSLRDSLEQINQANKLWDSLPLDLRKEFLNDKNEFIRTGMDVLKKKIEAEQQQQQTPEQTPGPQNQPSTINNKKE